MSGIAAIEGHCPTEVDSDLLEQRIVEGNLTHPDCQFQAESAERGTAEPPQEYGAFVRKRPTASRRDTKRGSGFHAESRSRGGGGRNVPDWIST